VRIDTVLVPAELNESALPGQAVAVVDVLRSSTSIVAALDAGCKEVIPAASIEEASKLAETLGRDHVLLCGEREGQKIGGFDLGNSPLEFTPETVKDKTLIMSTTNGTAATLRLKPATMVAIASFTNAGAVYQALKRSGAPATIVCAGKLGRFSLEDLLCAGAIVARALEEDAKAELSDGSRMAAQMYKKYAKNLHRILAKTEHGAYLISLGFKNDIKFCANLDTSLTVPILLESRIMKS